MSRQGMLYAITEEMYEFESIEDEYISTPRACELNKAWEGIHLCFKQGEWVEDDSTEAKVIFCGSFLLDYDDHVITLKSAQDIGEIKEFLCTVDIEGLIKENFSKIKPDDYTLPLDQNGLDFLISWCHEIKSFYENAHKENLCVIFTVDL